MLCQAILAERNGEFIDGRNRDGPRDPWRKLFMYKCKVYVLMCEVIDRSLREIEQGSPDEYSVRDTLLSHAGEGEGAGPSAQTNTNESYRVVISLDFVLSRLCVGCSLHPLHILRQV